MIRAVPDLRVVGVEMQPHPAAEIFPMMTGADFDALVADIKANGQREPIVIHDGLILDGRNRYRACRQLGIETETLDWSQRGAPEAFVVSMNLHRRHLNESQRALIAARLSPLKKGDVRSQCLDSTSDSGGQQIYRPLLSADKSAALLNVSPKSVQYAKKVLHEATPEEIAAVERGETTVSTLARDINKGQSPEKRKSSRNAPLAQNGKNPERIQRMQMQADIWAKLSEALLGLTSLPLPTDVAEIVNANPNRRRIVDEKLARALQWLKDFDDACNRG